MARVVMRRWPGLPGFLLLACFCFSIPAAAFELSLGISSGYDDNPRQEKGSEGALFTQAELDLGWTLKKDFLPATTISLFGFADYRSCNGLDDNWHLGSGLTSTTPITGMPVNLIFFSEAESYRNPLVDDNEYDALSLGSNLTWFTGPQLSLELETILGWEDYCNKVISGRHPHKNSIAFNRTSSAPGHPAPRNSSERNDRRFTSSLKSLYAFSPYFDGSAAIFWRHRHSSIAAECRQAYGLNLDLGWQPVPTVAINWQLGGERVPYKNRYKKETRTDNNYNTGIEISWYLHNFTLQTDWNWSKRDSIVNEDDYQRNQWQIRLKYSY